MALPAWKAAAEVVLLAPAPPLLVLVLVAVAVWMVLLARLAPFVALVAKCGFVQ